MRRRDGETKEEMRRRAGGTATGSGDVHTGFVVEKCVALNSLDHRRLQARGANQMRYLTPFKVPYVLRSMRDVLSLLLRTLYGVLYSILFSTLCTEYFVLYSICRSDNQRFLYSSTSGID